MLSLTDSRSMVKLQNIFHEYERSIQKARSRHGYLVDKVSQLEMERTELKSSLEEVKDIKSALERNQLELQTEVTNIKFQLKQEQENRRNATMMYNNTKDKLRRTEEQHQFEVQERQKLELTLRNLELEMRTLVNNMKQVLRYKIPSKLSYIFITINIENLLSSHLRKQQEIEDENKRNISKSSEVILTLIWLKKKKTKTVFEQSAPTDDLQVQLEKEASRRSQLERMNGELKDQLASMRGLSHSNDQQERSKRQLEEEVLDLRRRMEAAHSEQSNVEQYRRDAEERARQEIQQKLEQVNLFLQSQAASQEALDQIKSANEANLRSQLEQKIRELEGDLGRARTTHHDSLNQRDSTRTELERYRQLYAEELRLRKSLAAKLERANTRLSEANSKLLNERSRSLITSSIANGSLAGPSLDVGSLGSPAHYGNTLGPLNRSFGLGLSLLSPVTDGQNSRVEDYLAKVCTVMNRYSHSVRGGNFKR
uniref:Uncharacterized protein n=1 Tax=Labrus bergylta TaxID=56723 RepID=A0A3Q3G8W1_9LABR